MEPHFGCNPDCFDYERNAMVVVAKGTKMFEKQNSKCFPCNACPFGRGLR